MTKIYEYFSPGFNCNVQVSYQNGLLKKVELVDNTVEEVFFNNGNNENTKAYFFIYENGFLSATKGKTAIIEIAREITFDIFWDKYRFKTSGKSEAMRAWEKLSKANQVAAYDYIDQYESLLKVQLVAKLYASSYLNAKRWIK